MCEKRLGRPAEAQQLLEASVPHLEGALQTQTGLDLLEILYQTGDFDKALDLARVLQRANPANVDVLYSAYRIYMDLANHTRDSLALVAPESARMHELMAQHLVNEGDLPSALVQYRQAQ